MLDFKLPWWTGVAAFPGTFAAFGTALAGGAYMGYSASNGMPVQHEGMYFVGAPIAGGALSTISPLSLRGLLGDEDGDSIPFAKELFGIGVFGSAALLPIGYGLGYVAGRLTQ